MQPQQTYVLVMWLKGGHPRQNDTNYVIEQLFYTIYYLNNENKNARGKITLKIDIKFYQ